MNKREAKRRVCSAVAAIIRGHIDNGAEYLDLHLDEEDDNDLEYQRMVDAAEELAAELSRRG